MHWDRYRTHQHDSLANFYIIYKSSWEYSQALDNDCLQGLVARVVPGTLWLGPAAHLQPGPRHGWGVRTEDTSPSSQGKRYEWFCVTCTHSLWDSFPAGSTKSHGTCREPPATLLQRVGTFWGAAGSQAKLCASVLRPEEGLDHFWFTNIFIASVYPFPLSNEGGQGSFTWFSIPAMCRVCPGKL